jgi:hypothetical protein
MRIDLSDFDNRREAIAYDLIKAATQDGFFYGNKHIIDMTNYAIKTDIFLFLKKKL